VNFFIGWIRFVVVLKPPKHGGKITPAGLLDALAAGYQLLIIEVCADNPLIFHWLWVEYYLRVAWSEATE
jgi:hypothetical protein